MVGAGIIFGDPDDERGHRQADEARPHQVHGGEAGSGVGGDRLIEVAAERVPSRAVDGGDGKQSRGPEALVQSAHDRAVAAEADHVGADDRGDDAHPADQERQGHQRDQLRCAAERQRDRDHRDPDRDDIGFEQVRGHSGAVADIVADVVGDHRRVARIVLGNPGFDLADQVGADVGGLGEDAAAETGEDRHQRGAQRERGQSGHDRAVIGRVAAGAGQVPEQARNREQRQSGHQHAGDGAGAEGGGEALLEAAAGGLGGADVGPHRNVHADEAGRARQDRTDQESDGRKPAEENDRSGSRRQRRRW